MEKVFVQRRRPVMLGDLMQLHTHQGACFIRIDTIDFIRDQLCHHKHNNEVIGTCLIGVRSGQRETCWHSAYQVAELYDEYMSGFVDITDQEKHAATACTGDVIDALFPEPADDDAD